MIKSDIIKSIEMETGSKIERDRGTDRQIEKEGETEPQLCLWDKATEWSYYIVRTSELQTPPPPQSRGLSLVQWITEP